MQVPKLQWLHKNKYVWKHVQDMSGRDSPNLSNKLTVQCFCEVLSCCRHSSSSPAYIILYIREASNNWEAMIISKHHFGE